MELLGAGIVVAVLALALALFWTEWLRPELVALLVMVLLMVFGIVTPEEGVSGFSNTATITVLALFVISAGVNGSGLISYVGRRLSGFVGSSQWRLVLLMVLIAGPASAFLNNTAVVAILIPLVLALAAAGRISPSKVLMPLSQIAMLAGTTTLIGTSTNVLASSLVEGRTGAGLGMFQFAQVGLIVFVVGVAYVLFVGRWLIPERIRPGESPEQALLPEFVAEFRVLPGSPLVGKSPSESQALSNDQAQPVRVLRGGKALAGDASLIPLQEGDVVALRANRSNLVHLESEAKVQILSGVDAADVVGDAGHLAEIIVAPSSSLVRRPVTEGRVARDFGVRVLGVKTHAWKPFGYVFTTRLVLGDTLLVLASDQALERLRADPDFIVSSPSPSERLRPRMAWTSAAIAVAVVASAALGIVPILVASLAGATAMVLLRVLKPEQLWESVRWDVVFLMAGMIPLGIALEKTGIAAWAGSAVAGMATGLPDWGLIGLFYVASMVLTAVLSNNGTIVLLVPIAFATAASLAITPIPLVLATMFAASNDFNTPIGYQTNLMVYGPGGYRFTDYARVGLPLSLLLACVTSLALAFFFPLR